MVDAFVEENPDATQEEWDFAFGTPEELASQLMEEYEQNIKKSSIKHQLSYTRTANILLVVALVCVGIIFYMYFFSKGYTNVETTQYIYITDDESQSPSSTTVYCFN